ncbi:MAG TPA: hypothetical protein VK745_32895 [Polyangiaceae bacterium]|nr:hypothetical protein [Polyangiaceae bacterium]
MALTIIVFHVERAPIRSLRQHGRARDVQQARGAPSRDKCDTHPRQTMRAISVFSRSRACAHVAGEISASHNFEVEHERKIFDMRKPSDEA